jgi:hypothetical protein
MFYLSRLEHTFRLPPSLLSLPREEAVKGELERLFLDKVSSMVFSSHCFFTGINQPLLTSSERLYSCCVEGYCNIGSLCLHL